MNDLTIAVEIAHEAGQLLRRHWREDAACVGKGSWDIVTAADHAAEELITRRLRSAFPHQQVVGEESYSAAGCESSLGGQCTFWLVDPLDGTKNFHHRHEAFCTMMARVRHGEPELAVIYDPMRRETFWAERGKGAFRDGEPIRTSSTAALEQALVASGFPSGKRHRHLDMGPFQRVLMAVQGLRRTGCTGLDLAYVASGRFDAMWDQGLAAWDLAPGLLIALEAGAVACQWDGSPFRLGAERLIVAAPPLLDELCVLVG